MNQLGKIKSIKERINTLYSLLSGAKECGVVSSSGVSFLLRSTKRALFSNSTTPLLTTKLRDSSLKNLTWSTWIITSFTMSSTFLIFLNNLLLSQLPHLCAYIQYH